MFAWCRKKKEGRKEKKRRKKNTFLDIFIFRSFRKIHVFSSRAFVSFKFLFPVHDYFRFIGIFLITKRKKKGAKVNRGAVSSCACTFHYPTLATEKDCLRIFFFFFNHDTLFFVLSLFFVYASQSAAEKRHREGNDRITEQKEGKRTRPN